MTVSENQTPIPQRVNHIKKAWAEGRPAYGLITKAPGASLARTLAGLQRYGLDYIVLDAEHGNYDLASLHDSYHAIAALGVSPIARCPGMGSEQWDIRIALDAGAHGIMVPLVETRAQAEDIVHRAKYPPSGGRTSGGSFNLQSFHLEHGRTLTQQEYFANANEATLIIAIIETARGLENIDEIVQVKGLDAIFIGQYDLALSLGALPQSDTRVIDGVERIFQASKRAGIPVIAWSPGAEAPAAVKKGYEAITVGLDTSTVTRAFAEDLALAGATQRW